MRRFLFLAGLLLLWVGAPGQVRGVDRYITLGSTTSPQHSGLYDYLLPQFTATSGIEVRAVAVGTGKALRMGRTGDVDLLIVHHTPSELAFVARGFGNSRANLMVNDFMIVGPRGDPAGVTAASSPAEALQLIAGAGAMFISRGDESGTHLRENRLWEATGLVPAAAVDSWYRETGAGMGATLNVASALNAYLLTDRATWLKFANKGELAILFQGSPDRDAPLLFNQYGVVTISQQRHPHIKSEDARVFRDWLLSAAGQSAIDSYRINGEQAFFGNAAP